MTLDLRPERDLAPFFQNRLVGRILHRLSSGKEAVVYCCEAGPALPKHELVAAKIYRPPERRAFRRHMEYADGRHVHGRTAKAAIDARKDYGRRILFEQWIAFEYQVLVRLYTRGGRVPEPLGCQDYVVLMEYLGDRGGPAPQLRQTSLPEQEVRRVSEILMDEIELMLGNNLIHGDLSPYNVLCWAGEPFVIDVPQALDPRENLRAEPLLRRDVTRIAEWARSHGVDVDGDSLATDLWIRWLRGEL